MGNVFNKFNIYAFIATLIFAPGKFHAPSITVSRINGMDAKKLMTKNTYQHFDEPIEIGQVIISREKQLELTGLLNDRDPAHFEPEYLRTFGDQEMDVLNVKELYVNNDIGIESNELNDIPLSDFIQINQPNIKIVASNLNFSSVKVDNLIFGSTINGRDYRTWSTNTMMKRGRLVQTVTSQWKVQELMANNIEGSGTLNNIDVHNFSNKLNAIRAAKEAELQNYRNYSRALCEKLHKIAKKTRNEVYFLKYFEEAFTLNFNMSSEITSTLFFGSFESIFYLVNTGCSTIFFVWDPENETFKRHLSFLTGRYDDWVSLIDGDRVKLFSTSKKSLNECPSPGFLTWTFDGNNLRPDIILSNETESLALNEGHAPHSIIVLNETSNVQTVIVEMDVNGTQTDEWIVPRSNLNMVPGEANVGLAFGDGKQMLRLGEFNLVYFMSCFVLNLYKLFMPVVY